MKKVIILVVGLMALSGVSLAQVTSFDHDKYWFYRWRLTHMFLHKGETDYNCSDPFNLVSGFSIPAGSIKAAYKANPQDVLMGKNAFPHWGDGTSFIGWYMGVLATEWRLLKNQGQATTAVEQELYYAMKAYERLDKNVGILFSPNQALNCATPDGFFGRDDVTRKFVSAFFPNSIADSTHSDYLDNNTIIVSGKLVVGGPEDQMVNHQAPDGESHPYNSVDQVSDLMMGFALVVKCLTQYPGDPGPSYNGYNFKTQAKFYTTLMMNYLKSNHYYIREPITGKVVMYGDIESLQDAYPLSRAADRIVNESWGSDSFTGQFDDPATNLSSSVWQLRQTFAEDIEIGKQNEYVLAYRHELAAIGHSWQFGAIPVKCGRFPIATVPWPPWIIYKDFWRYDMNFDPTGIDEFFGPTGLLKDLPIDLTSPIGKIVLKLVTKLACVPVKPPTLAVNSTGFTLSRQGKKFNTQLYALMHHYLNGGNNLISDSFYQEAISSAPCDGPHYFPDNTSFQAPRGWRSSVRWQKRITAFDWDKDHHEDDQVFNGLDYMLLYNLWALEHPADIKVNYSDELNPVYNFSGTSVSGRYYGFESINITGTVTSSTGAIFLSPETHLKTGTKLTGNITISAPANGVSLQCDASGRSYSRVAATEVTKSDDDYKKEYAQYLAQELAPQIQKAVEELAKHKYVPIQEYVKKGPTVLKESNDGDSPVKLYPNPSSGVFTLSSDKPMVEVRLETLLGEPLIVKKVDNGSTSITIEAFRLPAETYICVIQTTDGVVVKKWIKK